MSNSVRVFHNGNLVATYGTIQAAIDDASTEDGYTIVVSAGTYAEHVVLSKSVTLSGANDGVDGAEARGAETVITGGVKIAADGVSVDGVQISGSYDTSSTPDATVPPRIGLLIGGADATIENSVLTGDAFDSRPFGTCSPRRPASSISTTTSCRTGLGGRPISPPAAMAFSITHNTFLDNAGGVFSEGMSL